MPVRAATRSAGLALVVLAALTAPAAARPIDYRLDQGRSEVGFAADAGAQVIRGTMPVETADLTLDFDRVAGSSVRVTLDAAAARASLPFATEAMKSEGVLNTARFPKIRFESTAFVATKTGARVSGRITIRGVTQMATLDATIYRPPGSAPDARDRLTVHLTGAISRAAFGATGFAGLVGDEVRLRIVARIEAAD